MSRRSQSLDQPPSSQVSVSLNVTQDLYSTVQAFAEREFGWLVEDGHPVNDVVALAFIQLCRAGLRAEGVTTAAMPHWLERRQAKKVLPFPGAE